MSASALDSKLNPIFKAANAMKMSAASLVSQSKKAKELAEILEKYFEGNTKGEKAAEILLEVSDVLKENSGAVASASLGIEEYAGSLLDS